MDNSPYYNIRVNEHLTKSSVKNEMIQWLQRQGIQCVMDRKNGNLLHLSNKQKPVEAEKVLLKHHGCQVHPTDLSNVSYGYTPAEPSLHFCHHLSPGSRTVNDKCQPWVISYELNKDRVEQSSRTLRVFRDEHRRPGPSRDRELPERWRANKGRKVSEAGYTSSQELLESKSSQRIGTAKGREFPEA
ncbi:hypothetical protein J6590_059229 [Homalodisca vitripennis]|nr:hypothetical protein J6590_059229 [Homalodisca vitripennis]